MSGADTNAATGVGMLAVLAYTIYWVVRSRKRWRTILYSLLSAAAVFLVACLAAWMLPLMREQWERWQASFCSSRWQSPLRSMRDSQFGTAQ
jgi:high-affinity Fe2+/Pb2+ permease